MPDYPEWTIKCDGGCGRVMRTSSLTTLWTVTTCPDCKRIAAGPVDATEGITDA